MKNIKTIKKHTIHIFLLINFITIISNQTFGEEEETCADFSLRSSGRGSKMQIINSTPWTIAVSNVGLACIKQWYTISGGETTYSSCCTDNPSNQPNEFNNIASSKTSDQADWEFWMPTKLDFTLDQSRSTYNLDLKTDITPPNQRNKDPQKTADDACTNMNFTKDYLYNNMPFSIIVSCEQSSWNNNIKIEFTSSNLRTLKK